MLILQKPAHTQRKRCRKEAAHGGACLCKKAAHAFFGTAVFQNKSLNL
jgi:hypothetical protein